MDDLQRLFARYRLLLLIAVVIGAGAGLAVSLTKARKYRATAALHVQDVTLFEGFGGSSPAPLTGPAQLAAASARAVSTDPVLASTAAATGESVQSLRKAVTAAVDPLSSLVLVSATAASAGRAAAIANAAASATTAIANADARSTFAGYAAQLARQIARSPNTAASRTVRDHDQASLSLLHTLAIVAQPVQIQQRADVPTGPQSRHIPFDALLGGALGLLLGLTLAFVREALDRTVHRPQDVASKLNLPILGHVQDSALRAAGDGDADSAALFGVLRRNVELLAGGEQRTILVTSAGAEEGKTTVATSLASSFARVGRETLLVEADLRRPALAGRLQLQSEPGLSNHLSGGTSFEEILQTPPGGPESLRCIVAGAAADPEGLLASRALPDLVRSAVDRFEIVIVDAPPLMPVPDTLELMPLMDAYLLCLRAGRTRLGELSALRELLERLPPRPAGAVVTGVTKGDYQLGAALGRYQYVQPT